MVYMAEIAAMMVGTGTGSDGLAYRFYHTVLERLEITENTLQDIIGRPYSSYQEVKNMLSMV